MPSAALRLQEGCSALGATLCCFVNSHGGTAQPASLLGHCWHLVERQGSGWHTNTVWVSPTEGGSQADPTLYCRVCISNESGACKKRSHGNEKTTLQFTHNIGSQHRQTQRPLCITLVFAPFTTLNLNSLTRKSVMHIIMRINIMS